MCVLVIFFFFVQVVTLRERASPICMEVTNGKALQQCADWWANFILQYSIDSWAASLTSAVFDGIWITESEIRCACRGASWCLFIYLCCFVAESLLEHKKSPQNISIPPIRSAKINLRERILMSCLHLMSIWGSASPITVHCCEAEDKVALKCVRFWVAKIKSETSCGAKDAIFIWCCSCLLRENVPLLINIIWVNVLPVVSWLFWLVAGLTGWTGWLKTTIDLWPWPEPLPLADPGVVLLTAPRPRRRPLPERRRLPLPPAWAAVRACSTSSAAFSLKLADLPTCRSKRMKLTW